MPRHCSDCGIDSPWRAVVCPCGYNFARKVNPARPRQRVARATNVEHQRPPIGRARATSAQVYTIALLTVAVSTLLGVHWAVTALAAGEVAFLMLAPEFS